MIGYHGTFHRIEAWRLPTLDEQQSKGPAAICFTPSIDVARQYCTGRPAHAELCDLYARQRDVRLNWIDAAGRELPGRGAQLAILQAEIDRVRATWDAAGNPVEERIYRSSIAPRNRLHFNAEGRPHYNLTGHSGRMDDPRPKLDIWALARQAILAGHDCLIVERVVDRGRHDAPEVPETSILVFDPAILSPPELVHEGLRYEGRAPAA